MRLTTEQVEQIKILLAEDKLTQKEIGKQFSVGRSVISDIATGRIHRHVKGPAAPQKASRGQPRHIEPTPARMLELEAEIEHLKDERAFTKRKLKAATKDIGLFQAMAEELQGAIVPMRILPSARVLLPAATVTEHLVMHISDGHHDQVVSPEECGGLERHDFSVACCRAEQYVDTVIKWTQQTLAPQFNFPRLTILAYGDHTSGEIHGHVPRSYYQNVFKNCLAIGQLHSLMYRDLAPYFEHVNIVYVPGNHGRRSEKKDYHGAQNNWDYLIAKIAELYCKDMGNVSFTIPNAFSINLDIEGVGFCVFHGDDIRSNLGIPWYGLERKQRRTMALSRVQGGPLVRYYCCGHFHRPGSTTEVDGEMLINGTWVATDAFAYNALSGFTEPTQLLHGVHPKYGITWRLPVKVRSPYEATGPRRYKLIMKDTVGL